MVKPLEIAAIAELNRMVAARDGQEALDYLSDAGGAADDRALPQVLLLDLKLPKVDGLEVPMRVRADPKTQTPARSRADLLAGGAGSHRKL